MQWSAGSEFGVVPEVPLRFRPRATPEDYDRLCRVADLYHTRKIVQFQWRKGVSSVFLELDRDTLQWNKTTGTDVFG